MSISHFLNIVITIPKSEEIHGEEDLGGEEVLMDSTQLGLVIVLVLFSNFLRPETKTFPCILLDLIFIGCYFSGPNYIYPFSISISVSPSS